jgi:hypothetical protein
MKDRYPRGRRESDRERWSPHPSGEPWNQSWHQAPHLDDHGGQFFSYGWQHKLRPQRPPSIQTAVALMYVGAGLVGLTFIWDLLGRHGLIMGYGAASLNRGGLGSADALGLTIGSALGAAFGILLWIWMASANKAGKRWARIVTTLFFAIDTVSIAFLVHELGGFKHLAAGVGGSLLAVVLIAADWGLRLTIVALLWRRDSSDYYAAMTAAGY